MYQGTFCKLSETRQVDFSTAPALLLMVSVPKDQMRRSMGDLGGFASVSVKFHVSPKHCSLNFQDDGYIILLNWCFNAVLFDDAHNEMSLRFHDTIAIVHAPSQVIFTPP